MLLLWLCEKTPCPTLGSSDLTGIQDSCLLTLSITSFSIRGKVHWRNENENMKWKQRATQIVQPYGTDGSQPFRISGRPDIAGREDSFPATAIVTSLSWIQERRCTYFWENMIIIQNTIVKRNQHYKTLQIQWKSIWNSSRLPLTHWKSCR